MLLNKNKNRFIVLIALVLASTLVLTSCSSEESEESQPKIVTSFYPLEFAASRIAGDLAEVTNITPLGAEPHDIELTPSLTEEIMDADLVVVMGADFQPAIEKTASSRDGATIDVFEALEKNKVDLSTSVSFTKHGDEDHGDESHSDEEKSSTKEDEDHDHGSQDPHIWLDPVIFRSAVNVVADQIIDLIPDSKVEIENNRDSLLEDLDTLDTEFKDGLSSCESTTFITSHDAFSFLAKKYGLTQESIAGISPENEPSPARIIELKELVQSKNIDVIFTEETVSTKVADTLSREADIKTDILSPLESLTKEQDESGEDYFSIMRTNLSKLSSALRCEQAT